jgi:hypothetical protein
MMLNLSQSEGPDRRLTGVIESRPEPKPMMTGGSLADLSIQPPDLNTAVISGSNAVHARNSGHLDTAANFMKVKS